MGMNISDFLAQNTTNTYSALFGGSNSNNSNSANSLFGTSNNKQDLGIFGSINLSNYNSIKSGSYQKLMKNYYSDQVDPNSQEAKAAALKIQNKLSKLSDSSSKLSSTINDLMDKDYTEENREDIISDLKKFVSEYNNMVDYALDSENKSVLQKGKWMSNTTFMNQDQLSKIGINIDENSKLKFDESIAGKADLKDIRSAFGAGTNNFSNKVLYKAEQIYSLAMTGGTSADSYTSSGAYNRDYSKSTNLFNTTL